MEDLDSRTYPMGKAQNRPFKKEVLYQSIIMVESAPLRLRERITTLNEDELELKYREDSWTVRQIVHHLADSHMHMWVRFKQALTLENPIIQVYNPDIWANSAEYKAAPLSASLLIFEGVQERFSSLLKIMSEDDFNRTYFHPQYNREFTLSEATQLYAWHGLHHVAQIEGIFK